MPQAAPSCCRRSQHWRPPSVCQSAALTHRESSFNHPTPSGPASLRPPLGSAQELSRRPKVYEHGLACQSSITAAAQSLPPGDLAEPTTADMAVPSHVSRLQKYGPIYKRGTPGMEVVVVAEPDSVQALLTADYASLANDWGEGVSTLLGPGAIANRQGDAHRASKRTLTKGFSKEATLAYLPGVVKLAASFLSRWSSQGSVPLLGEMKCLTFDISCSLIMGFDVEEKERRKLREDFTTLTFGLSAIPFNRSNPVAAAGLDARARLLEHIQPRLSSLPHGNNGSSKPSAKMTPIQRLNAVAEAEGEEMPMEELLDQSINLLMASTETTAFSMCNMMMELESRPHIAQKLADEQRALMDRHGTDISEAVLEDMHYGEAVACEVLRVHSPVPFVFRRALIDLEVGGYTIPKGWILQLSLHQQQLDSNMAPDQPGFYPERWLDASGDLIEQPRNFMPFGGGPRLCLGRMLAKMEMKVMMALFVRGYTCKQPSQQQALTANVAARDDVIQMSFTPRQ
ncbi:hypothetical protein WJX74_002010 [Apatococcus lobatus]|uniref:Cytochrome P450 n=1 Tax=Apatococcus lobatus TaxID=904363 RepID=A0AAW1QA02_9CHLO